MYKYIQYSYLSQYNTYTAKAERSLVYHPQECLARKAWSRHLHVLIGGEHIHCIYSCKML